MMTGFFGSYLDNYFGSLFSSFIEDADEEIINKCTVYGNISDISGNSYNKNFYIKLNKDAVLYKDETIIFSSETSITPDENGDWEIDLVECENMEDNSYYEVTFNFRKFFISVPNESRVSFNSIIIAP